METVYKLKGVVQPYTWGGTAFIPQLLGLPNEEDKPFAEYWLGAHPNAPALVQNGTSIPLNDFINQQPALVLGDRVAGRFGSLPYLFKVLDVRQMLSIQVHPSKVAAEEEYEKENQKGTPLAAPDRNYKDQNHKPELMVALSDFWLLHGFKPVAELNDIFRKVPALSFLKRDFEQGGYRKMYEAVMTMPQERVNEILEPLVQDILPTYKSGGLKKEDEHFWAARAALSFCKNDSYDRGIFSIYLFNLLHLKKGEGIYQPAGLPHAYLEGQNIEIMANSDNVLRAGLTDKHIDVAELMKHVVFEATHPKVIPAAGVTEQAFETSAEEFLLKKYDASGPLPLEVESATILLVYEGELSVKDSSRSVVLQKGEAALLLPAHSLLVEPAGPVIFFTATTP